MLIHYARFAWRLLRRSPAYTAITIGGFAVALASCVLVLLFVRHELGYDAWLPDADRLYRVHMRLTMPGRVPITTPRSLGPLHERLVADPAVAASGRLVRMARTVVLHEGRTAYETLTFADPSVFEVLDVPMASGERRLTDPRACLVSQRFASRYFGTADPIGRTLDLRVNSRTLELRIVGVLRDLPPQSHLDLELVAPIDPLDPLLADPMKSWENVFGLTYLRLRPGADPAEIEARLDRVIAAHAPELPDAGSVHSAFAAMLVPVRDLHLGGATEEDRAPDSPMRSPGDPATLYAIAVVGLLLLAIAIGNFVNLTTARAGRRAREIAVRKAAGAQRRDIIVQYLGEAVLIAVVALVGALMLAELALPWFEQLAARDIEPPHDLGLLAALAGVAIALGLVSGIYPALVLARYQPSVVMNQNQASVAGGSGRLRAVLVFAQFAAAIALALGAGVVYRQARYAADVNLGFAKRDRLQIHGTGAQAVREKLDVWLDRMAKLPGVEAVSMASDLPGRPTGLNTLVEVPGAPDRRGLLHLFTVDYELFEVMEIPILAGRGFSRAIASDDLTSEAPREGERAVILNEAAVRRLGLGTPAEAVGRALAVGISRDETAPFRVVGVVPDFHFDSMRTVVDPAVFVRNRGGLWGAVVRFTPGAGPEVRDRLEALWHELFPERPFATDYVETQIDALYRNERRLSLILTAATLLALVVACLGLYGLTAYLAESRRKEIAIRKVLGASTTDIVRLLAWRLVRPIALACVVAVPLAYLAAERWLAGFAYRISIGAGTIAATVAGALAIAAATIAAQSLYAARARPVDALRLE